MIIQIYSKPACTYCDQAEKIAEQIVQAMPANYEKLMLDVDFSMDELIEKVPNAKTFPQVFTESFRGWNGWQTNMINESIKVGFVASCFDLLHAGHICMLREAKDNCDYLICALQTDPTTDRPDEKNPPVQSVYERYEQLQAVRYVNEIIPYETEESLVDLLLARNPDIRFLGQEYEWKEYTGRELDIEIHYTNREHSFSTTSLRKRVVVNENNMCKTKV
jgi:glycerol-3-phosphate cytidylyltransferase